MDCDAGDPVQQISSIVKQTPAGVPHDFPKAGLSLFERARLSCFPPSSQDLHNVV